MSVSQSRHVLSIMAHRDRGCVRADSLKAETLFTAAVTLANGHCPGSVSANQSPLFILLTNQRTDKLTRECQSSLPGRPGSWTLSGLVKISHSIKSPGTEANKSLAPTGALGVTLCVCLFGTKLSRAHNLHLLASDSSS